MLLSYKLDFYWIASSLITKLLFLRCQQLKFLNLLLEQDEVFDELKKNDIVQATIHELVDVRGICQVPLPDELLNASIDEPLYWYPVINFRKTPT